jgi:DNA-binding SARP family transcriptional activator/Tfp pilus assembly protein PilF
MHFAREGLMTTRLITLGGLRAIRDDGELDWLPGQRLRAALLVHVAVEGRVSRAALATVFWPDSDEAHARAALRQSLYHLRTVLGAGCLDSVSHELRVGPGVQTDARAFSAALDRGDPETAARLYGGPFLDGVHLADLQLWEQWVDGRRLEYARRFRSACREWLDGRRAAGDLAGALDAARCWATPDPSDDEAQHRLIETLIDAGERAEALRQYEAYGRLLEPEGLRPLDATVELVERARSGAAPWPTRRESPDPPETKPVNATPSATTRGRSTRSRRPILALAGTGALVMLLSAFWLVQPRWSTERNDARIASGEIEAGERIILADFDGPPADPALGAVVTDALRFELLATQALRPVDRAEVRDVLARMQVAETRPLTPDLAREVGLRNGVRALLEGQIAQAGTGYVLTAALRSTASGRVLAAFRETADSPDEVIPAIDRLSLEVRGRAGRVLPSADTTVALERVTTASLDALRAYTLAERALRQRDMPRGTALLADALELDPEFAMAWRLLAVTLGNTGLDRSRELEAATRAYELRHRLAPRERHLAEAGYHDRVTADLHAAMEAYRRVLDHDPADRVALNNLGLIHWRLGDLDTGAALLQSAADLPDAPPITYLSLVRTHLARARPRDAPRRSGSSARRPGPGARPDGPSRPLAGSHPGSTDPPGRG